MRLNHCFSVLGLSLLVAGVASASELDNLRATLAGMHASEPLAATLDVRNKSLDGDKDKPETTQAHLKLSVSVGAEGLQLGFSNALLKRVAAEKAAHAKDPNKSSPTAGLLGDVGPAQLHAMVDFTPSLLRRLEGAKLLSQRDEVHDDKPSHLLVFSVPAGLGKSDSDAVKHFKGDLKVWLDKDSVPLAVDESRVYKGRKFLISFESSSAISATVQRVGQRLITTHMRIESKGSGFGQSHDSVTNFTLTPQVAGPATGSVAPAASGSVTK